MKAADQFHVGVVVHDLDAALTELSALFGYEWCPQLAVSTPVVLPEGEATLDLVFTYSRKFASPEGCPRARSESIEESVKQANSRSASPPVRLSRARLAL